ncbi:MAG TPA: DUF4416 family protein [Candidatus Binatia bacterium]|nr:DUF4416 family protein [Candidatus Binatia bacterium]
MGTPRKPKPAKYFVALLSSSPELLPAVEADLISLLDEIDGRSEVIAWSASTFYEKEMGTGLLRYFLSFLTPRSPEDLAAIKLQTQRIEERYRNQASAGRQVNLDPGYLDAFKVVLASTKNASQRIYLHSGIYGEATLFYHDGGFHGLSYTYPDYLWSETLAFLTTLRNAYLAQLRGLG